MATAWVHVKFSVQSSLKTNSVCVRVFKSDFSCGLIGENFVLSQQAHSESTLSELVSILLDAQVEKMLLFCNIWKTEIEERDSWKKTILTNVKSCTDIRINIKTLNAKGTKTLSISPHHPMTSAMCIHVMLFKLKHISEDLTVSWKAVYETKYKPIRAKARFVSWVKE